MTIWSGCKDVSHRRPCLQIIIMIWCNTNQTASIFSFVGQNLQCSASVFHIQSQMFVNWTQCHQLITVCQRNSSKLFQMRHKQIFYPLFHPSRSLFGTVLFLPNQKNLRQLIDFHQTNWVYGIIHPFWDREMGKKNLTHKHLQTITHIHKHTWRIWPFPSPEWIFPGNLLQLFFSRGEWLAAARIRAATKNGDSDGKAQKHIIWFSLCLSREGPRPRASV